MRSLLSMHEYCAPIAGYAWLASLSVCALAGIAARVLWKPSPEADLGKSEVVWERILSNVIVGTGLAVTAVSTLYGACGWFGRECWKGGFCEAAWKGPPWILVSGIAAAPAAVLLWHWRTVQRGIDQKHRELELAHSNESAVAERFAEGARLLSDASAVAQVAGIKTLHALASEHRHRVNETVETLASFIQARSSERRETPDFPAQEAFRAVADLTWHAEVPLFLHGARLTGCRVDRCAIRPKSVLKEVWLDEASATEAKFNGVTFIGCNLSQADLSHAEFVGANVSGNMSRSCVREGNFCGANLTQAVLSDADVRDATYDDSTRFMNGFRRKESGMRRIN